MWLTFLKKSSWLQWWGVWQEWQQDQLGSYNNLGDDSSLNQDGGRGSMSSESVANWIYGWLHVAWEKKKGLQDSSKVSILCNLKDGIPTNYIVKTMVKRIWGGKIIRLVLYVNFEMPLSIRIAILNSQLNIYKSDVQEGIPRVGIHFESCQWQRNLEARDKLAKQRKMKPKHYSRRY